MIIKGKRILDEFGNLLLVRVSFSGDKGKGWLDAWFSRNLWEDGIDGGFDLDLLLLDMATDTDNANPN